MEISVVVPIHNERDNIPILYRQLRDVLESYGPPFELLFVDDGSEDGSRDLLQSLAATDTRVKVIVFRRNFGQTAAMQAGLRRASGQTIVTIDGDLQNDPGDIPTMVDKLHEGFDLVHGWRRDRQDPFVSRRLPSLMANWLISRVARFPIHDLGCTLKVMRREIAHELELYGEMHRFIPILARQRGARCAEVVTRHHPRKFGVSKYGISRTQRVLLDLITVKYLLDYFASPMKLFGWLGLLCTVMGVSAGAGTVAMKLFGGTDMTGNPLILLTVFTWLAGLQFFSLGLLGEVLARVYFAARPQQNYAVREQINLEESESSFSRAA